VADVKLSGFREFDRALATMSVAADRASRQLVVDGSRRLRTLMKRAASSATHPPTRHGHLAGTGPGPNKASGRLVGSIHSQRPRQRKGAWSARTGVGVAYGHAVNDQYPIVAPAVEALKQDWPRLVTTAWGKAVRRV
jgi:hypothetical protein